MLVSDYRAARFSPSRGLADALNLGLTDNRRLRSIKCSARYWIRGFERAAQAVGAVAVTRSWWRRTSTIRLTSAFFGIWFAVEWERELEPAPKRRETDADAEMSALGAEPASLPLKNPRKPRQPGRPWKSGPFLQDTMK